MAKKVQVIVDVNSSSVKVASDDTLTLTQQVRELRKALQTVPEGTKEWTLIQQKYNETKDSLDRVNVKSKELFGTMSALPGPIGQVSGQLDNTVGVLKTFSSIKFTDVKTQFVELGKDLRGIGVALLDLTGITKLYQLSTKAATSALVAMGVAEETAAVAAKGLSGALIATGIGAVVVTLGLLIANFDKVKDSMTNATEESKAYEEAQTKVTDAVKDFNVKLIDVKNSLKAAKEGTKSKEAALKEYNEKLGETIGYAGSLEQAEALMAANTAVVIESLKLRTEAQVMYAKAAEYSAKIVSGETTEIGFWEGFYNYAANLGDWGATAVANAEDMQAKINDARKAITKLNAEGDILTNKAIENDKKLKKGLAKPPEEPKKGGGKKEETPAEKAARLKKEAAAVQAEVDKVADDAYAKSLSDKDRELYEAGKKYNDLLQKAKQYNLDTTALREAYEQEQININAKYDEAKAVKDKEKADKDAEAKFKADQEAYKYQYEQNQKIIDLDKQRADAVVLQNQVITQSWIDLGNNISGVLGSLAQTFAGNEDLQKIFAVTQVAVNTASSIGAILLSGQSQQAEYNKAIAAGNASIALAATTAFIPGAQALAAAQFASGKAALAAGIAGKASTKINTTAQVAAAGIAGAAQIAAILSAKKNNAGSGAGASSSGATAPTPAFNGTVNVPAPVIGASQASSSGNLGQTIAGAIQNNNSTSRPIQAYVVGDQVSTQQQLDRRISVAAKMGG